MAVGDYEAIEAKRRAAWRQHMRTYDAETARHFDELTDHRARYLRELLAQLPFRWHVEHAYTPRETATYGGADHIVLDEEVRIGRLHRLPGDALSRPRAKFWGLSPVEDERLPSSIADVRIAERLVAAGDGNAAKTRSPQSRRGARRRGG